MAVGQGSPTATAAFAYHLDLPFTMLADPERVAYRAYGLTRGTLAQLLGPAVLLVHLRGLRRGARPGRIVGDTRQLPGAFIVDRRGDVRFAKPGAHAGDHAANAELLTALEGLEAAG